MSFFTYLRCISRAFPVQKRAKEILVPLFLGMFVFGVLVGFNALNMAVPAVALCAFMPQTVIRTTIITRSPSLYRTLPVSNAKLNTYWVLMCILIIPVFIALLVVWLCLYGLIISAVIMDFAPLITYYQMTVGAVVAMDGYSALHLSALLLICFGASQICLSTSKWGRLCAYSGCAGALLIVCEAVIFALGMYFSPEGSYIGINDGLRYIPGAWYILSVLFAAGVALAAAGVFLQFRRKPRFSDY